MSGRTDKFSVASDDLVLSQCDYCKHRGRLPGGGFTIPVCKAFPGHIPDEVLMNQVDHRKPIDGDDGVQFEPRDGLTDEDLAPLYRVLDALKA